MKEHFSKEKDMIIKGTLIITLFLLFSSISSLMTSGSYSTPESVAKKGDKEINPIIVGNHTYGGIKSDRGYAMIRTADGGFAIAGYTESYSVGERDFWLVKTNETGVIQWNQSYGGAKDEEAYAIISTPDGGFAISGWTESFGAGSRDIWLVKTDSKGIMEWNETYGDDGSQGAGFVIKTSDNGYLLASSTRPLGINQDSDMWIIKTDVSGVALWNETYGGEENDYGHSVVSTADGGFAVAGSTESHGEGEKDAWLVKTNASGEIKWNETYGGEYYDEATQVIQTLDGGFALTGYTTSYGAGSGDMWLVKTNEKGKIQFNQTYGESHHDMAYALIQTSDGGFALTGAYDPGTMLFDMWFVKTNSSGEIEFEIMFEGPLKEFGMSIIQISDVKYAIVGVSGYTDEDLWIIIFSSESEIGSTSTGVTSSETSTTTIETTSEEPTTTTSTTTTTTDITTDETPAWTIGILSFTLLILLFFRKKR